MDNKTINEIAAQIAQNYETAEVPMYGQRLCLPDRASVIAILELLQKLLFPAYFGDAQLLRLPPAQYSALLLQELAEKLTEQIANGKQELSYLESVLESIREAENMTDLAQIKEELIRTGYLSAKQDKKKRRQAKPVQGKPFHYRTSDGFDVFAGKNNTQNDLLTLKMAFKSDIWFHPQKIHGSHVILICDGREPTDTAMTEAAEIAAWHSQARGSSQIPVDYSQVRNIKKPNGAKPGMVIYHVYQTAFVTPDEKRIEAMRV